MDYRLLYDAGNSYEDLDLGDEAPAMNYQIVNLNELKDRQAAYSQAIKLPKTAHNLRVLGFIDSLAVVADAAYTPNRCELLCEGARISPAGTVLYVDNIDEEPGGYIECQIVSNAVDLFSLLGDVSNEQMGSDAWKGVWTSSQIVSDNAEEDGAKRWPAVFTQQGQSPDNPFPHSQVEVYHLVPCYRFTTMIEQLFRMYGYRVESDIFDDPYMKSLYITASKITKDSDVTAEYTGKRTSVPYPAGGTSIIYLSVDLDHVTQIETLGGLVKVPNENPSGPQWNQWRYYAAQPGDYKLEITINNVGSQPLDGKRRVRVLASATRGGTYNNPGKTMTLMDIDNPSNSVAPGKDWTLEIEAPGLNTGDYIGFEILIYSNKLNSFNEFTQIDVTAAVSLVHEDATPGVGSKFDFAQATGFKTYKEMVQTFMQLFCVLVDVVPVPGVGYDGIIGTVRMYSFQELYRRRDAGQYMDWSRKLVIDNERNMGFRLANYAQTNIIQLTDNTDDGTHDAGSFVVNNRTLESEKTLFTIAAEAGRNLTYIVGTGGAYEERAVAVVPTLDPMIETDEEGQTTTTSTYKGCNVHLVRIDEATVLNLRIKTGWHAPGELPSKPFPQALTVSMQEFVDRFYTPVKRLVSNARTISAYFNLSALDIEQLDLFTPVWIERYGCFFYISKINNFIAGQPTKVELVKMSSREDTVKYYITLSGRNQDVEMAIPTGAGKYWVNYRTNGTLRISTSGAFGGTATAKNGSIELNMDSNTTVWPMVGKVTLSVEEDPTVVREITVTQEGMESPTWLAIRLRTDGANLYVATSRPLKTYEDVVILTRGSGRVGYNLGPSYTRRYWKSKYRWHIPLAGFHVSETGEINISNRYRWWLKNKNGKTYVHIRKANRSRNFGYEVTCDMDMAVTFAVAVKTGKGRTAVEVSNRCYFESRCHIRNGVLTQELVVTK